MAPKDETEATRRALAQRLDCFTSSEFRSLVNITEGTEEAWRKRRTGPGYALVGNEVLYPREQVAMWLRQRVRERTQGDGGGL